MAQDVTLVLIIDRLNSVCASLRPPHPMVSFAFRSLPTAAKWMFGTSVGIALSLGSGLVLMEWQPGLAYRSATPTATTSTATPALPDVSPDVSPSLEPITIDHGTIEGTVIYPSEVLHAQKVCAEDITTGAEYCTETGENVGTYRLQVPPSTYYVYAIACQNYMRTPGIICPVGNYDETIRAYYNEFVTCGLHQGCESDALIPVTVTAGETVTGVNPHDWYSRLGN